MLPPFYKPRPLRQVGIGDCTTCCGDIYTETNKFKGQSCAEMILDNPCDGIFSGWYGQYCCTTCS